VQVFRCSVVEEKKKRNAREWKKREREKNRIYNRTTSERNDMYVCLSKRVREKILLLSLYYIE